MGEGAQNQHTLGLLVRFLASLSKVRYEKARVIPLNKLEFTLTLILHISIKS